MFAATLLLACAPDLPEPQEITIDDGTYYALVPTTWSGDELLPASLHYHGAGGSPQQYYNNEDVVADFNDAGVLLLLPEGVDGFFRSDTTWGTGRDDMAFTESVWEDAETRWDLDPDRQYATGFSVGGNMAAMLGCEHGDRYAALAPMSGGFWFPAPETCDGPAVPISHTHGTADTTWPLDGRCFREAADGSCDAGQSPMEDNLAIWTDQLQCGSVSETYTDGPLSCETWTDCGGDELRLCLHDEGHTRVDGWGARQLSWLLQHEL